MIKTSPIDWQTVQKYIRFRQPDQNRDSTWLMKNSKCWKYLFLSLSIELMQF